MKFILGKAKSLIFIFLEERADATSTRLGRGVTLLVNERFPDA
jgi:hypothetical protein